jgi:hypothetical protein
MTKRNNPRGEHLRRALAQEAARIMSEQGIEDYLVAKRKAAQRWGAVDASVLPKNSEIEAALAEHHRLFGAQKHAATLRQLRQTALQAMQMLQEFEPRLVGPVLSGTASEHTDITLHLFAEMPEAVSLHLMDVQVPFESAQRRFRYEPDRVVSYPAFRFVAAGQLIDAVVFPIDGIRQAPPSPVDGRPMQRADAANLEVLLGEPEKSVSWR